MISTRRFRRLILALGVSAATAAEAATYLPVSDRSLVDRAPVAVIGRVEARASSGRTSVYGLTVERVLKGFVPNPAISVSVPGNENFTVPGMPRFQEGERVILFLSPHADGMFRIVELMLGAFKESPVTGSAETRAQRDLAGSTSLGDPQAEPRRDFEEFAAWIESRARGDLMVGTYLRPEAEAVAGEAIRESAPYTLLGIDPSRWTEFDRGLTVPWVVRLGGSGLTGGRSDRFSDRTERL